MEIAHRLGAVETPPPSFRGVAECPSAPGRSRPPDFVGILPSLLVFWAFWLGLAGVLTWCIPASAWLLKPQGLVLSLGVLGLLRYSWQILHAVRAYYYRFVAFPRRRRAADGLGGQYPRRLFFVVPSYKEDYAVSSQCFGS